MATFRDVVNAPLMLVPQHFGCTVFDRSTSKYYPFDAETAAILMTLAEKPLNAVMEATDDPTVQAQIWGFFEHFYELGFFDADGRFMGGVLDIDPPQDHLAGPLAVHLEVMAACNLTCTHCFAGELPRHEERLNLDEIQMVFEDMAGMGSYRLGLTGGEPLMRREIFDIMDMATDVGLHPCITTNALLITEEIAKEFGKRDLVWLNVSLDGATSATNDLVRGKGTFDRVLDKLKILADHARFTLAFTIMQTNVEEIEACAALAYEVGASTAVFRPLYPVGIAREHLDQLMPTFEQYNEALNVLAGLDVDGHHQPDLRSIDPFSPHHREEGQAVTYGNHGCGAGNLVCSVSVSGDVNPCSFLGSDFVAANVRDQPLSEIWRSSHQFQAMRALEGGTTDTFSGGCRARSLVFQGDANAPDPWLDDQVALAGQAAERRSNVTFYDPLTVLEVNGDRPRG